jgi:hypothetical protein
MLILATALTEALSTARILAEMIVKRIVEG